MQTIKIGGTGADSRRVLEALTPLHGSGAPAVNSDYLGQTYVDDDNKAVYFSVATDSEVPANDWDVADANAVLATATAALAEAINDLRDELTPLTGVVAPSAHANYIGQMYVDTVAAKVYTAVATDSTSAADDWVELTQVSAG